MIQELLQHWCITWPSQLLQCLGFNLADALARYPELAGNIR